MIWKRKTFIELNEEVKAAKNKVRRDKNLTDKQKEEKIRIIESESDPLLIEAEQRDYGTEGDS